MQAWLNHSRALAPRFKMAFVAVAASLPVCVFAASEAASTPDSSASATARSITVTAERGDAVGIAGIVNIYLGCNVRVEVGKPRIIVDPACDPKLQQKVEAEQRRIAALEGKPANKLSAAQVAEVVHVVRTSYRSTRTAQQELNASMYSLEAANQMLERAKQLYAVGAMSTPGLQATQADLMFAREGLREKRAAFQFSLSNNPLDELEIYRARVRRAQYLALRATAHVDETRVRFDTGRDSFSTLAAAVTKNSLEKEAAIAACGALLDQTNYLIALGQKAAADDQADQICGGQKVTLAPSAASAPSESASAPQVP